jgi:hypothetical protein
VIICEPLPNVWFYQNQSGFVIKDWSRLPAIIEALLAKEKTLEAKSADALNYWNNIVSERAVAFRISQFVQSVGTSAARP